MSSDDPMTSKVTHEESRGWNAKKNNIIRGISGSSYELIHSPYRFYRLEL